MTIAWNDLGSVHYLWPGVGGRKFCDLLSGGGGGGQLFLRILFWRGDFFLTHYFAKLFFRESDMTCIITVVGAQQQHKACF